MNKRTRRAARHDAVANAVRSPVTPPNYQGFTPLEVARIRERLACKLPCTASEIAIAAGAPVAWVVSNRDIY